MKLFKDLPSQDTPITAESLNQIKDKLVVVSATEPTGDDREKVWIQKGKNLFDASKYIMDLPQNTNSPWCYIKLEPNTQYTMSSNIPLDNNAAGLFIVTRGNTSPTTSENGVWNGNPRTITSDSEGYIGVRCRKVPNSTLADLTTYQYQIEKGTTATEYEAYIDPKIYVKNDNDEYEEFIKEEDSGWQFITETGQSYSYIRYRRIGKMVELSSPWYSETGISISAYKTTLLGTLPEGFRPSQTVHAPIMCKNSNNEIINFCNVLISTDGTIKISNVTGSSSSTICTIYFNVMYFAD